MKSFNELLGMVPKTFVTFLLGISMCGFAMLFFYDMYQKQKDFADAAWYGAVSAIQLSRMPENRNKTLQDLRFSIVVNAAKLQSDAAKNQELLDDFAYLKPKPVEPQTAKLDSAATTNGAKVAK